MNDTIKLGLAFAVAILAAMFLGILLGRRVGGRSGPLGLPEGSVRGLLALEVVTGVLLMVAVGAVVPDFLSTAFGLIIGLYFGAAMTRQNATAEPQRPQRPETPSSGRASLPLLLCVISASAVTLSALPGCVTSTGGAIGVVQDSVDDIADRVGIDSKYVDAARVRVAKSEAARVGLKVVPTNAVILPPNATPFAKEYREIATDRIISGGVYAREVFEVRTILAPAPTPQAPAPDVAKPNPEPIEQPHSGATTFPTGQPGAVNPPVVAPSSSVIESHTYSATVHVTAASGALAASISNATAVATIAVAGAPGWPTNGGAVTVAGAVQSLEGVPPGIAVSSLVWSGVVAMVKDGLLSADSTENDVAFSLTASLADGHVIGQAVPKVGTAVGAFLQSLEIDGSAVLVSSHWKTNVTAEAQSTQRVESADFVGITTWNGENTSQWPVTVHISDVGFSGGNITWKGGRERIGRWNEVHGDKCINGETCLVIPSRATAGHFDFLGCEQNNKILGNLSGEGFLGGMPKSGDRVGFYICTINRHGRNFEMRERSNVVWINWP